MLNLFQRPRPVLQFCAALKSSGRPWTLKQVQGDEELDSRVGYGRTSLATRRHLPHIAQMAKRSLYQRLRSTAQVRLALFILGVVMMAISPIVGILPGPGFIILFPLGLMLCLQNSAWAKRIYVRFKWRHPRYAAWTDRVMRRASAARKRERAALDAIKSAAFHGKTPEKRANGD